MAIQVYKVGAESRSFAGSAPVVRVYNVGAESGTFNAVVPGIRVYHLGASASPLSSPVAWMYNGTTWVGYEIWADPNTNGTWIRYDI